MASNSYWSGQDWAEYHRKKRAVVSDFFAGVDGDVRNIFLNLPYHKHEVVFRKYEESFGKGARQYAQRVFKKWKSGEVMMSGDISLRLLQFLPPLLSFEQKCGLIEKLWERTQQRRQIKIVVTPNTDFDPLVETIWKAILEQHSTSIPDRIKRFLAWLTENDAIAAQAVVKSVSLGLNRVMIGTLREELSKVLNYAHSARGLHFSGIKTIYVGQLTIRLKCSLKDSVSAKLWRILPW